MLLAQPLSKVFLLLIILFQSFQNGETTCASLIQRKGVRVTCKNPETEEPINCYQTKVPSGTVANFVCDNYYSASESFEEAPERKLICNNSKWKGAAAFNSYSCQLDCGTTRGLEIEKFVIGGRHTTAERWPWHSSIFVIKNKEFTYQCGGTLVNTFNEGFVILTAAHCLLDEFDKRINPNQLRVVLGGQKSDLNENRNDFHAQVFSVQNIVIHEGYLGERVQHRNDIAILKMEGSIQITNTVSPVCLSANSDLALSHLKIGTFGQVVGFGKFSNDNEKDVPSPVLRQAQLPIVDKEGCYQWQKYHLDDSQICAGYLNALSVCKGDSGGGYIFPREINGKTRYYLQGIVSYGYVRNETFCENYGVFTKVYPHSKWIRDQVEAMYNTQEENLEGYGEGPSLDSSILGTSLKEINDSFNFANVLPTTTSPPVEATTCPICPEIERIECPTTSTTSSTTESVVSTTQESQVNKTERILNINSTSNLSPVDETTRILFPTNTPKPTTTGTPIILNTLSGNLFQAIENAEASAPFSSFELGGPSDYQNMALNMHNNYRAMHGVPPLRLNERLTREAMVYAHKLIRENSFVNEYPRGENPPSYNKNIFQIMETGVKTPMVALDVVRQAVNYWYSEINKYNWNNPGITTFSQMVWRSTTEMGLGVAIGYRGNTFRQVVVCAYAPPGNLQGAQYYRGNVFPRRY